MNARSLVGHYDAISNYIDCIPFKFNIIVITETWLNEFNVNLYSYSIYCLKNYSHVYIYSTKGRGGGVSVFIDNSLNYNIIDALTISLTNIADITTISVNILNKKYIVSGIYRSPSTDISTSDYILNNCELLTIKYNILMWLF